jgi:hypothetical protein
LVTLGVLVLSWLRKLKHSMAKRRKTEGDRYAGEIIQPLLIGQKSDSLYLINGIRSQLMVILREAVCALDQDNISNEAFQNMRGLWEISVDLLREQAAALKNSEAEIAAGLAQPVSSADTLAGDPLFCPVGPRRCGELGAAFPLAQCHDGERSR